MKITQKAIEIAAKITWDLKMANENIAHNRERLSRAEVELRSTSDNLFDIEIWAHECWSLGDQIKEDVQKAKSCLREFNQLALVLEVTTEDLFNELNVQAEFTHKMETKMRKQLHLPVLKHCVA
jgi:predicted  nucleic acid-binding Zn-ribbon protein